MGFVVRRRLKVANSHESSLVVCETPRGLRETVPFHLTNLFSDEPAALRSRSIGIYIILFVFNLGAGFWAIVAFHGFPPAPGTALVAYNFGSRHAVDSDHVAAMQY
jgi:hypothetical protein